MEITIVQGPFLPVPPLRGGAIEKAWYALGREFAGRGHQVTHISRCYKGLPEEENAEGVYHRRVRGFDAPPALTTRLLCDVIYAARVIHVLPRADVLVTNTVTLPIMVRTRRWGALYVHVGRYPKAQVRLYRHAARLQAPSRAIRDAVVARLPGAAARVSVIPYPISLPGERLDPARSWLNREKLILYVGRLHPEKGIDILLEAFRRFLDSGVRGWRLAIVGPWEWASGGGGECYYRALLQKVCAVPGSVEVIGPVFDGDQLSALYRRAKLFVYPSVAERGEALGLAPLEAMACGCPAVVSRLKCFEDYVEDGESGYIFDHRAANAAQALASKLQEVALAEEELSRVAFRAYEVAQRYRLARVADSYLADFEAVRQAQARKPEGVVLGR